MRKWIDAMLALSVLLAAWGIPQAQPLRVAATVPELGSLARAIGGEQVTVVVFAKGTEDAHFVEAKPSFIKELSQADVYLQVGLELEVGWAPVLLQNARNSKIALGAPGYIDAATVITPLGVPPGPVDRAMGDVHAGGNPHYLTDPLNGLRVAELLKDRLGVLRPAYQQDFAQRYAAFRDRLSTALVGAALAQKYDVTKLALLFEHGRLATFLQSQNETQLLGGWLGAMLPYSGTKVVVDHDLWVYFLQRFGLTLHGSMEPKPGVPPSTKHLQTLAQTMQAARITVLLTAAYYDPRHAQFLAQHAGATVVPMAHQAGARPGTDEYLEMIDYNIRQLTVALAGTHRQ
ncbi:MAG: zinc ABC transporter substrate-binding protein [Candidatus Tectomicrobia bacterium]|uniref:Zinc ABC transporter substrate-binding protein n=1 Tax=Tectimicrobiota bacterium TaxID=2528274 RepID=A0A938B4B9_UNCTE|nr:zinc ABC transporter substrate-binding protein [Candidatus Tectomicrobia bacterium]